MKMDSKRYVRLVVERLEERCVPAYLAVTTGVPQTVRGASNMARIEGFQLQANLQTLSEPYFAPNGQRQIVQSSIQAIGSPTDAEWALLGQFRFPRYQFVPTAVGLADNTYVVTAFESLDPSRQTPMEAAAMPKVGQSLFIRYDPSGQDPPRNSFYWLQFVTTNALPNRQGVQADVPYVDNNGTPDPFYNVGGGGPADGTGFSDVPWRQTRNALLYWQADLFIAQEFPVEGGWRYVVWQGVRWRWETVAAPNRAPEGIANSVTTPENTAYVFVPADFGFTDPHDNPPNNFQAVKISTLPNVGALTCNGTAVNAGDFVSVSDIDSGLLVFTPATNATGSPYDDFTFQVQDDGGTADGGVDTDPIPRTMTVNVMSSSFVNHAPAGADNTVTTLENKDYVFSATDFGFADPNDSPTNDLRAVQITSLPTGGTLSDNGITLSVGDFVSVSHINDGVLIYIPAANSGGTSYDSFAFKVQDDGGTYNGGANTDSTARTMTINVTMVNQPPEGADNTVTTLENTPYTFTAADFGFTDPNDSPANSFSAVKIGSLPYFGTLTNNGAAVSEGDFVSVSDINAGYLVFTPDANLSGTPFTGFLFQVQDDGGTDGGGVDTDPSPRLMMFNVTWVNQAPAGTSHTVSTSHDTPYTFTAADFGFTDPHDDPPNDFYRVKVVTLPSAGTLTNNGVALSAGDFVTVSDINNHKLVFTPAANAYGTPYASFTFTVQDDGGTANGGVDLDPSPKTMTIEVTGSVISWATITTNGYISGTMWSNEPMYFNQPVVWAFGIAAGPGDDPLQGFGVSLTCNSDGTFNVGPYVNEYVVYWGPPQTNNIEADYDPETLTYHIQLTFLDLDDNEVTIDLYCG